MKWFRALWNKAGTEGLKVPHAHDPNGRPSVRLLFASLSGAVAVASVVLLHSKPQLLLATWTAIGFYVVCSVLYMFKHLTKAKFDLNDQEIDLEGSDGSTESGKKEEK